MATLGKNQVFEIKNGDGTSFHNLVLRKSAVESIVMSLGDKISGDVYYKDNSLSVTMHEYITYNGVNYMLVNPPTIVREGIVSDNSELKGMTKYSFVFYHPMCQLANFPFSDVAVTSDETRYLSEGKTFSWIGKPADFVAKLNKNLTGTEWIAELSSRFPQDKLDELSNVIPFDKATIADACKTFYDTWGVPYVVDKVASTEASYSTGKRFKIVMGLPSNEIYENASAEQQNTPFVFQMGHGVGLKNNSRTPRNNKIITRISGYGSENNIPYGYPQVRWYGTVGQAFTYGDHAGVYTDVTIDGVHLDKVISYPIYKGILDGEYVELIKHPFTRAHLMPSVYRTCLFNKISFLDDNGEFNTDYDPDITLVDYYDAVYSSQYPYPNTINLQAPSYESHEFEDEKPELGEAHIISATPLNNDLTPASSWDDSLDDEGNYKQSYFQMVLPQLSFDLYACASITEEMQINMRSGACLGCTFTVQVDWDDYKRNFYDEEGNFAPNGSQRDLTKYPKSNQGSISLVLQKDNSTFGTLMPNMYQYPKGETSAGAGDGDTFVILGISLPESYIFAAEWRLDADMKSYMLENNIHYFDYPLKFDEDFLFHNENILSQIRPNTVVRFNYAGQTQALFVKQITVKYGDQPLPQYDITLTDNVEVVLNQIGHVAEDVEKLSTLIAILRQSYGKNVWNELAKKLSKTQDDTAAGYITMLKGLQVGANFIPDILGEGGVLRMNNDGKVELVVDTIYARMRAYFDSVVIREYRHESGNRIKSPAQGFNASRVEYIKIVSGAETIVEDASEADFFRCYWRVDDGERKAENQFVIGDLAFCEHSDVANGSLVTKRYWRVVTGRNSGNTTTADGEAWIDLSNVHNASGNPVMTTITYTGQGGTTQTKSVLSFESGSDIPEAHDDICMLGCVTDSTRQGAIIEYVSGANAPSYQIYQSIGSDATNPYVLTNKNQITIGYNSATGKADMKVYGDAYIGARDRSTFIEYKQDDGTQQHAPVLNIKAKIQTLPNSTYEGKTASQFVQDNQLKYDTDIQNLTNITNDLQSQIDGEIVSWFYEGTPTLDNAPAVDWDTDTLKERHLGDMYYDVGTGVTSGFAYRFIKSEQGVYAWQYIDDTAITLALAKAAEALGLASSKAKTYTTANNVLPSAPYNVGDLWLNATGTWGSGANAVTWENEILKCINACSADGTPDISDWVKASKYTDDSAFNGYINAFLNGSGASGDSATAAAIQKAIASALGSGTVVDGGLLLTSLIGMRKYKGSGSRTDVANYDTWAGISGQYDANVFGGGMAAWYGGGMLDKETLTTEQIAQGWNTLRWAKGVDRFDGSGYRADGNLSWDKDGIMTIANVYSDVNGTLVPWSGTTLQYMTNLSNIMPISLVGGVTYLDPQVGFKQLSVLGKEVATQEWVNGNFVTKTFFDNLFRVYNGAESVANKIAVNGNLPSDTSNLNIEAMFGFWTKKYISALGQGDDGSTSYTTLAQLNDVNLSNPTANQVLSYNGTHWVNKSIELGSQTLADLTDVTITSPAANQMLGYDATNQKWINVNVPETYTLPAASTTALGGIKIGYSGTTAKTYAVVLDSGNKAYVSVPWENTWRGIQNNLTSQSTTDSLSAYQGYLLANGSARDNTKLPLSGGTMTGKLQVNAPIVGYNYSQQHNAAAFIFDKSGSNWTGIGANGEADTIYFSACGSEGAWVNDYKQIWKFNGNIKADKVQIGSIELQYDSTNNAIKVVKSDGAAASLYATGGVSALGMSEDGSAGAGDVTWALLASNSDTRQIALSHLTTSLTTITGGTTDSTNKKYAVYKNSSNQLFVDVPWTAGSGTVTSVKVGSTSYTPTNGVISLPAYPTSLPASDVYSWAKTSTKPTYSYSEITGTPTIPAAANNGTFSIKTLVGSTTTTISDFTANQSTADDITLVQGANVTFTLDTTNRKLTIAAKDTTYTLAGLIGSSAKGSTTQPIYWNGSAFVNTTYTLGKSVPSDAVFTDHYAWSDITGKPSSFTPSAHTHSYIEAKGIYTFDSSTLPNSFDLGVSAGFVNSNSGFGSYGSVLTVRTYSGGGGTLQLYAPYSNTYGGSHLKARFGNYDSASGNSWTTLKDVAWVSDIPTKVSQLTNDSGYITSSGSCSYANSAGTSSYVSINYNNDSNSTYQMLWGSGNGVYGTGGIYCNPYTDYLYSGSFYCGNWFRSSGNTGWYNESYGGGWYMKDTSWVRTYNGKGVVASGYYHTGYGSSAYALTSDGGAAHIGSMSVNYASSSGSTPLMTIDNSIAYGRRGMQFAQTAGEVGTDPTKFQNPANDWYSHIIMNHGNSAGYYVDLAFCFHSDDFRFRRVQAGSGTSWGTFITSTNIGSQSVNYATSAGYASSAGNADTVDGYHESAFLHLSGGTMTGSLKLTTGIGIEDSQYGGLLVCKPTDWTGITSSQWGAGTAIQGVLRSDDTPLIHYRLSGSSGTAYEIIDSKGGQTINSSLQIGSSNGAYLQIGAIRLVYDSSNNAVKVIKSDGGNANLYATGGVSALGVGQESGGGGDVTWALLANNSDTRQIAQSHLNVLGGYLKTTASNTAYNVNGLYNAGLYMCSGGSSNMPFGAQYGVILSLPYRNAYGNTSTDFSTQIALPNGDDSSYPNSMFYRTSLRSSWNAWQRVQNVSMSDVRLKTILSNPTFGVEQIANAPIIRYLWSKEGYGDKNVHIGSTAQYWMNVANEFVEQEYNGYYSLQYGVAALISAITVARKVMTHEEKIALLETRVSALEKENGEQEQLINSLQEELAKFKSA